MPRINNHFNNIHFNNLHLRADLDVARGDLLHDEQRAVGVKDADERVHLQHIILSLKQESDEYYYLKHRNEPRKGGCIVGLMFG